MLPKTKSPDDYLLDDIHCGQCRWELFNSVNSADSASGHS